MKIYIYKTIDDWNEQSTDYVLDGSILRIDGGIANIQDQNGNRQFINLNQVFCLVESNS